MPGLRRILAAIAATLATAAAAGCGGGPEDVSAEELVARGDEICKRGQERFAEIQAEPLASASEGAEQTEALIEESEDELDELRDLGPPEELRSAYERYLDARAQALEFFRRGRDAAEAQDAGAYVETQEAVAKSAPDRRRLAEAVGFEVCSNPATEQG